MGHSLRNPIRYRRNPRPLPEQGPKVFCEVSGFPTYAGHLVRDEEGQWVDPRYGGFDIKTGRDREGQLT